MIFRVPEFKVESTRDKIHRLARWHDWFAWYPVRFTERAGPAYYGRVVWLETISRRLEFWNDDAGLCSGWIREYIPK
jgi:hypothetical protein